MKVMGIDPGITGAIALLEDGYLIEVVDMPVLEDGAKGRRTVNAPLLASIVYRMQPDVAFVEFVGPRPGEGAVGAFTFGRCRGCIEGVLAGCGVSQTLITPPVWKRAVGIAPGKEGAKDAARSEAIRRWPGLAAQFARKCDHGRAEAAFCAVAGLGRGNAL